LVLQLNGQFMNDGMQKYNNGRMISDLSG